VAGKRKCASREGDAAGDAGQDAGAELARVAARQAELAAALRRLLQQAPELHEPVSKALAMADATHAWLRVPDS
jgi:hypothetical protein